MTNPYADLGPTHFWKSAVAAEGGGLVLPRPARTFRIARQDRVATAGSCFAQNVAKHIRATGRLRFVQTEPLADDDPVFSGRYGNIYTARQLDALAAEVLDGPPDAGCAIRRRDGRWVDANRPYMSAEGYERPEDVVAARAAHVAAIRPVFTDCEVFVFTLGLTESWLSPEGDRIYPMCPGVYSDDPNHPFRFHNFGVAEVVADMERFLGRLRAVNPAARVILTVSPVPLTATYTKEHVLSATLLSKSVLRAAAGELVARHDHVAYFPSYEMIANPFREGHAYEANLRSVRADAIAEVMSAFDSAFLDPPDAAPAAAAIASDRPAAPSRAEDEAGRPRDDVICDDVEIERSIGF